MRAFFVTFLNMLKSWKSWVFVAVTVALFLVPGFAKFVVVKKPATKARKGTNPFTGEEMMFKAKPARKIVRARPVKAAKDAV